MNRRLDFGGDLEPGLVHQALVLGAGSQFRIDDKLPYTLVASPSGDCGTASSGTSRPQSPMRRSASHRRDRSGHERRAAQRDERA